MLDPRQCGSNRMQPASCFLFLSLAVTGLGLPVTVAGHPAVYKCVEPGGRAAYQSVPCRDGVTQAWAREVTVSVPAAPAPVAADEGRRTVATRRSSAASSPDLPRSHSRAVARPRIDTRAAACETAKIRRADIRDRQWRTIRFDQLRELDEEVARACRG